MQNDKQNNKNINTDVSSRTNENKTAEKERTGNERDISEIDQHEGKMENGETGDFNNKDEN